MTVLIPTHGRPTLLKRTLESLKACALPEIYRELVVIENGSRDGAEQLVAALPQRLNARYMYETWGNKSNALNAALKTIEDGLVVFFDDDVRVHADTLMAYAEAAEGREEGAFFGGPVRVERQKDPPFWLEPRLPTSARGYQLGDERESTWYLGFNWAGFVVDIKELGGFDFRFGPGSSTGGSGQETHMQKRMRSIGITPVDVPAAVVFHYVPSERCTLTWSLKRKYAKGIGEYHMSSNKNQYVMNSITNLLKGVGVLIKGSLIYDRYRASLGAHSIAEALGSLRAFAMK